MTTVGISMVKDEADIIAATVNHMLHQVDAVIVADNGSSDATRAILDHIAAVDPRLQVVDDPDVGYMQSDKMTRLAGLANFEFGADWIVPFDADEIWYSPFEDRVADMLDRVPEPFHVVPAQLFDHVCTSEDPDHADPTCRIGWRQTSPGALPKVACRYRADLVIEMGNHGAHYDAWYPTWDPALVIRHFPYRSYTQVLSKIRNGAAAIAATDLDDMYCAHWRKWGAFDDDTIDVLFHRWFWRRHPRAPLEVDDEVLPPLVYDPAPVAR